VRRQFTAAAGFFNNRRRFGSAHFTSTEEGGYTMQATLNRTSEPPFQPAAAPILNIVGERVALGPYDHDLMPFYLKWINDFEVMRHFLGRLAPCTRERRETWYARVSPGMEDSMDFTIYERETRRPIGYTTLEAINYINRAATFGLMIGEKDCWGKGYGAETTRLMLDYGFTALRLHNIMLIVDRDNERAVRTYLRAGFRVIGERRESRYLAGRVSGELYMDCLATEFTSPLLHRLGEEAPGPA
jgi:RimJ/RimL family protein N-acetyltransferase